MSDKDVGLARLQSRYEYVQGFLTEEITDAALKLVELQRRYDTEHPQRGTDLHAEYWAAHARLSQLTKIDFPTHIELFAVALQDAEKRIVVQKKWIAEHTPIRTKSTFGGIIQRPPLIIEDDD